MNINKNFNKQHDLISGPALFYRIDTPMAPFLTISEKSYQELFTQLAIALRVIFSFFMYCFIVTSLNYCPPNVTLFLEIRVKIN